MSSPPQEQKKNVRRARTGKRDAHEIPIAAVGCADVAGLRMHPTWREYIGRNMYEDVYMNAEQFTRYLAARQSEPCQVLNEMGPVLKK